MPVVAYTLFAIHCALLLWSVGGFLEMILPEVFWKPFTNPEFPDWVLIIHWGSVLVASTTFIFGFLTHWSKTPMIMAIAYGMMALVCAIETLGFMTSKMKYVAMGAEYLAYTIILLLLFKSGYFISHFNR